MDSELVSNEALHRVNDVLSGQPETELIAAFYACIGRWGFDHPSTKGCLLALNREAWNSPLAEIKPHLLARDGDFVAEGWVFVPNSRAHEFTRINGPTDLEALVKSLLRSPWGQ